MEFKTIVTNLDNLRIKRMGINAQQLHDHIINPTLEYMGGNYNSKNARFLMLCTAAVESNCGEYLKQINGPALGIWQMEPATHNDICIHTDGYGHNPKLISSLVPAPKSYHNGLVVSPMYACAMARLKYSMDKAALPDYDNFRAVYDYYKRIYNTPAGASTYEKFKQACVNNKILEVDLD